MPDRISADQIKAVMAQHGIHSLDDLTKQMAASQTDGIVKHDPGNAADSWIIKVWKLDNKLGDIKTLPQTMGGNLLMHR